MEKNQNLNPELEEMREQFRMLTEKVDKQNIVTNQLIREVSKSKVFKYDFVKHYGLVLVALFASAYGVYMTIDFGYPFWTSFSFFYMAGLLFRASFKHYERESKYLESINYDLATFWERQESILKKRHTFKSVCIPLLELSPVFIHGVFLCRYLRSIGEIKIPGDYWWLYLLLLICVLLVTTFFFAKAYCRVLLELFKDSDK